MSDPFVTVFRTTNPIDAEMVADVLSQNDIVARAIGTRHAAIIGAAQNIMQLRVEVPSSQAEMACEFIEAFFAAGELGTVVADEQDEDQADDDEADEAAAERGEVDDTRSHLLALGSALVVFGGSHFYAGRAHTAVVIALGQAWAVFTMVGTHCLVTTNALGALVFGGLICYDIVGAQLAVMAKNRGENLTGARQVLVSVLVVLGVLGLAALAAPSVVANSERVDRCQSFER